MTTIARSSHTTSLHDGEIVEESDLGSMRRVTADNLPILKGLSIKRVLLNPGAMRTPHWHANANELTYCVSGTALVSILDDGSTFSTFVITAGQMFHAASGSLHHIENIGDDTAEFIIAFRNERPEDFGLGATFGAFSDAVLGNTYDLPASDFATIHRTTRDHKLAARVGNPDIPRAPTSKTPTSSTSKPRPPDSTTSAATPASPATSSGRRSRTSRCTRYGSPKAVCANRIGIPSPPRWAMCSTATPG